MAVKIRSVRLGGNGLSKARAHLRYIQRDGAERQGKPGLLYGPERDAVDDNAFLEEGKDDRHQFRIIVSPEEAGDLADLKAFTRDVMAAAERDLETRLDWVAVNHHDTDHPHVHIVLRGKDDYGKDLVIARNYITHGFRNRAEELATLELGPRRDIDIAKSRFADVEKERFTKLDRNLLDVAENSVVQLSKPATPFDRFQSKLLLGRLRALEKMKLAHRDDGEWRLSPQLEPALKDLGRRGDIIRSMSAALGSQLTIDSLREFSSENAPEKIIGRIAGSGAADDAHESRFFAIDGADGNQWHVAVEFEPGAAPPVGAIVEASQSLGRPRKSDRTIAVIANENGGRYSDDLHRAADPSARDEYRLAHKRRLEALRRAGIVDRHDDGSWRIPENYLERAAAFETSRAASKIEVLSWVALDTLPEAPAQTFLDDALEQGRDFGAAQNRFGAELNTAMAARRRWLLRNDLAVQTGDRFGIDRESLQRLEHDAMNASASAIARETGKKFAPPVEGETIAGKYVRPVDLPSGRFALIEKSKEFTLAPWREALERRRGLEISGTMQRGKVSWDFARRMRGLGR
ncbi:MAG: DUF3363 domain-containing protein [Oricola sp.]|uniref:DUF3363 domain-containing protein n=1 Tax=Hyphococcus sp. TaxID=2038636 RepID=UPI00320BF9BC|nr:DUF3363 domain-containing protein [Oricola sp.]